MCKSITIDRITKIFYLNFMCNQKDFVFDIFKESNTVKLGNKERFVKEQIGIKEPFPVTNLHLLHKDKELQGNQKVPHCQVRNLTSVSKKTVTKRSI